MRALVELIVSVFFIATICVAIKCCTQEPETIVVTKSDTVVVVKYDTLRYKVPVPVDRVVKDTFYVMVNADSVKKDTQNNAYYVKLEREQVHYSENGVYDAWVSGFQPRLDSFTVYGKETTTSIIQPTITYPKWSYYATITARQHNDKPFFGLGAQAVGNKCILGAEFGVLDNKFYYGLNLGIKLQ